MPPKENKEQITDDQDAPELKEVIEDKEAAQPEQSQPSPDDIEASSHGWTPEKEWKGDPDLWMSSKRFNQRANMMGEIKSLQNRVKVSERNFNARLEGQNKLSKIQLANTISQLEGQRNEAIELADTTKANNIQKQIDTTKDASREIEAPPVADNASDADLVKDWNSRNNWIMDRGTHKTLFARDKFDEYSSAKDMSIEQILKAIDRDVSSKFPDRNPERDTAPASEGSRSTPGRKVSVKLSWDQLTADEVKCYLPDAWKTKQDFLQAVADIRKGDS